MPRIELDANNSVFVNGLNQTKGLLQSQPWMLDDSLVYAFFWKAGLYQYGLYQYGYVHICHLQCTYFTTDTM
jgi:hypothetical protein